MTSGGVPTRSPAPRLPLPPVRPPTRTPETPCRRHKDRPSHPPTSRPSPPGPRRPRGVTVSLPVLVSGPSRPSFGTRPDRPPNDRVTRRQPTQPPPPPLQRTPQFHGLNVRDLPTPTGPDGRVRRPPPSPSLPRYVPEGHERVRLHRSPCVGTPVCPDAGRGKRGASPGPTWGMCRRYP